MKGDGACNAQAKSGTLSAGYRRKLKETDPHRLEQRQKAIDKGKNTRAYANYLNVIPK